MTDPVAAPMAVLDCRGQLCPQPVIELARHIGDVAIGELLTVIGDDPAAPNDIAAWCRMRGQDHVDQSGTGQVVITVRRRR